ncbi:Rhs element Vgr protein, partial [Pseudomonas amygdali pv. mori str. 301020]
KLIIEAGLEITFKAGGSFIKIDAGGVTVSGSQVKLNSGGSPGKGSEAAPLLPDLAVQPDRGDSGEMLAPAQTQAIKRKPFCEECAQASEKANK